MMVVYKDSGGTVIYKRPLEGGTYPRIGEKVKAVHKSKAHVVYEVQDIEWDLIKDVITISLFASMEWNHDS